MEGYAAVGGQWSRLFFMVFYLVMMVVMSVVVAFILEAFTFRMQYNQTVQEDKDDDEDKVHIFIGLSKEELRFIYSRTDDTMTLQQYTAALETEGMVRYEGTRRRTRVVLQRRMYRDEIPGWLLEADQQDRAASGNPVSHPVITTQTFPVRIEAQQGQSNTPSQTPPSFYGALNSSGLAESESPDT
ncbi:two pore calcium channel protein 1-like [Penaeus japonicus]|nr:two pore calcium channel protein 1-like [Penaeus japonicus]